MKIKTSDLIGPALDWAVCVAEGNSPVINPIRFGATRFGMFDSLLGDTIKEYSTDWAHGGPIIEQEKIKLDPRKGQWEATIWNEAEIQNPAYGPMILIAAMRCYCCAKLGDEIEIPQELHPCQQPYL